MKEPYEALDMEIREIPEEDVITVSGFEEELKTFRHDNHYAGWSSFM